MVVSFGTRTDYKQEMSKGQALAEAQKLLDRAQALIGKTSRTSQPPNTEPPASADVRSSSSSDSLRSSGITNEMGRLFGYSAKMQPSRKRPAYCPGRQRGHRREISSAWPTCISRL